MGVQDTEVPHGQDQLVEEDLVPVVGAVPGGREET